MRNKREFDKAVADVRDEWGRLYRLVEVKDAKDILRRSAASFLRVGQSPPGDFALWAAEELENPTPGKSIGRDPRNKLIYVCIEWVSKKHGVKATRTRARGGGHCGHEGGSAADVVGRAFGLGFSNCCKMWRVVSRKLKKV